MWLLDTNAWITYLNKKPSPLHQKVIAAPIASIYLCDIVKGELLFGAYNSARPAENLARLRELFDLVISLPFDGVAADHFGQIRAHLKKSGTPIGPYDLQIAAIARANDLIVVTHNQGEFGRVPDLRLEDWEL